MKKIPWSYSRLKEFKSCPRKFYHKNILKDVPKEDPAHFVRGRDVHKGFELYLKGSGGFTDLQLSMITKFKPILDMVAAAPELFVEQQLAFNESEQQVGYFDRDVWVRIVFDVVAISGNKATVIDWKTGKVYPDSDQLDFYAGAIAMWRPEVEVVTTAFIWADADAKPTMSVYSKQQAERKWQLFADESELIQLAAEAGNWQQKPSDEACKWCPLNRMQCQYSRR